jgi:hypothetical protein
MEHQAVLLGLAQIAVTLAGFSGLVVAMRSAPSSDWHPRDIWSLAWMFGSSFGALFLALLPLLLDLFHSSGHLLWKLPNIVMCVFLFAFVTAMALSSRTLTRSGHPPRVRYFPAAATVLLLICAILAGLAPVGMFTQQRVGFFVSGLIGCLIVSALSLIVFLVVLARAARPR